MYEKILVPLDGSELAEVALPYAEELAGRLGSQITLLCVSESDRVLPHYECDIYLKRLVDTTKRNAESCWGQGQGKEVKVETAILAGYPAEEIVDYAAKEDIGLVVMATHGRTGVKRWALGSVANKVVKATRRPVALIRARGARADVRQKGVLHRALVPVDGSMDGEAIMPYIEELASKLDVELTLIYILPRLYMTERQGRLDLLEELRASAREYLDKRLALLREKGIAAKAEFREVMAGAEAVEVVKLAAELNVDAVAMSTHGHYGVRETGEMTFGWVADNVLNGGNAPLILVRPS